MHTTPMASSAPPASTATGEPGAGPAPPLTGPKDPAPEPASSPKSLDIVFVQDSTGSQGSYISSARRAINDICKKISESPIFAQASSNSSTAATVKGNPAIRFGLVAFRDHPPQDRSWVTKNFGFTSDTEQMSKNLGTLVASGGGDGPEASTAGLADALNMPWNENAVKIVVLITDAPPHGLGEPGDGFPNGSPDQNDPLDIARQMAERGISLYVIACEPTLSRSYVHAVDFYRALTQITGGRIVPLTNASQLGNYIIGSAIETLETEDLIGQFEATILEDVYGQGKSVEEVMETIQAELNKRKVQVTTLNVEDIYKPSEVADENVSVWRKATALGAARGAVRSVGSRLAADPPRGPPAAPVLRSGGGGGVRRAAVRTRFTESSSSELRPPGSVERSTSSEGDTEDEDEDFPFWEEGSPRGKVSPVATGGRPLRPSRTAVSKAPSAPPPPSRAYSASVAVYPSAMPTSMPTPAKTSIAPQDVDKSQARRVVMQGLMRNAKVGAGGVLQPKGVWADKGPVTVE